MSEKPTYKITLSNGSTVLLRHLLNKDGWTKNIGDFITASSLLADIIPEPPAQPERPHPALAKDYRFELEQWRKDDAEWASGKTAEFTLTEKQRDNVKMCLKHSVEKNIAIPSKPAFDLFTAFGLTE